ncbi:AraC family transcriptional regulator [Nocardia sp. NPDC004604]|uniref:AraC family transcriptional regulator n=1 Tax=Nocardia sp. NPDC004604 TaxID=3157013 RepID=UPI0033A30398
MLRVPMAGARDDIGRVQRTPPIRGGPLEHETPMRRDGFDGSGTPFVPDDLSDVMVVAGAARSYRNSVHEEIKLVQVTGSGFTVRRRGSVYRAAPGELVALHADDAHSGAPDELGSASWRMMCLSPSLIAEVMPSETMRFGDVVVGDRALSNHFRTLHILLHRPGGRPGSALHREGGLLEFLGALAMRADRVGVPDIGSNAVRRISEVVRDYLRENVSRNVTLDELSGVTGTSKYQLVRACTAHFGLPPHKLHVRLRLDYVRWMLRGGMRIAEIAYATGFHDQPHLTRAFTAAYGMTPATYRASFHGTARRSWTLSAAQERTRPIQSNTPSVVVQSCERDTDDAAREGRVHQ